MSLPANIDSDKYERKSADLISRGDVVPVEVISTGELRERQVEHVERLSLGGTKIQIRYDNGATDVLPTNQRVYYREEK